MNSNFSETCNKCRTKAIPCEQQQYLVFRLGGSGLGAQISTLAIMLRQAVATQRALLVFRSATANFFYMDESVCPRQAYECYFHSNLFHKRHRCLDWAQSKWEQDETLLWDSVTADINSQFWTEYNHTITLAFVLRQRLDLSGPLPGLALAHPRRSIRQQLLAKSDQTFTGGVSQARYIGIHVRHGDKAMEYPLVPFVEYMREAKRFGDLLALRTVYLATDNSSIVTFDLQQYPDFRFVVQKIDRGGAAPGGSWYNESWDRLQLFLTAFLDIQFLTASSVFIGSQNSGFTGLVQRVRQLRSSALPNTGMLSQTRELHVVTANWQSD